MWTVQTIFGHKGQVSSSPGKSINVLIVVATGVPAYFQLFARRLAICQNRIGFWLMKQLIRKTNRELAIVYRPADIEKKQTTFFNLKISCSQMRCISGVTAKQMKRVYTEYAKLKTRMHACVHAAFIARAVTAAGRCPLIFDRAFHSTTSRFSSSYRDIFTTISEHVESRFWR